MNTAHCLVIVLHLLQLLNLKFNSIEVFETSKRVACQHDVIIERACQHDVPQTFDMMLSLKGPANMQR